MEDGITIIVAKKRETQLKCSPPPKYRELLSALQQANGDRYMGDTVSGIVKEYFNTMPKEQREQLIAMSKNRY